MKTRKLLVMLLTFTCMIGTTMWLSACASSGGGSRGYVRYGAGIRGAYARPWGYGPVYIGDIDDIDPDWGVEPPIAVPMPSMGMPDYGGGMDMGGMDMGGFDW